MIKINDIELEDIDLLDADVSERIEEAVNLVQKGMKEAEKIKVNSEGIRFTCNAIYDLFDTIFGEGTGEELFEGKKNLRTCMSAYFELQEVIISKQNEAEKEFSKYSPNRATRRGK